MVIPLYLKNKGSYVKIYIQDLKTAQQARLQILSQNQRGVQTQFLRIKQTIEKFLDKYKPMIERNRTLFCEQGVTIISILTALSMTISTIVLAIKDVFRGEGSSGSGSSPTKD